MVLYVGIGTILVHKTSGSSNMTEHDVEEFRLAFEGIDPRDYDKFDRIRMNNPHQTELCVGRGISADAARLLGRYIATNDHLRQLYIYNGLDVGSLFEGLGGSGSPSLNTLTIEPRLSEQVVQSMLLPFFL